MASSPIWSVQRTARHAPESPRDLSSSRRSWASSSTRDMDGAVGYRRICRLCAGALLWVAVAGCGSAGGYPAVSTYAPQGGVQAYSPTVTLNDVWLDAPEGVPRGGAADLRLYAVNDFGRRDALTGVTSPLVQDDRLRLDGRPVAQIPLPRGEAVNFEWSNRSGVRLTGFRRPLPVASWMPISLHFAHSKTITLQVVAGPLGPGPGMSTSTSTTAGELR